MAEDFATLDQMARGRSKLVVGKGAEAGHFGLFGLDEERQWDLQKERYERCWPAVERGGEPLTWEGEFRPPLKGVADVPRSVAAAAAFRHGRRPARRLPRAGGPSRRPALPTGNTVRTLRGHPRSPPHTGERYASPGHDRPPRGSPCGSVGLPSRTLDGESAAERSQGARTGRRRERLLQAAIGNGMAGLQTLVPPGRGRRAAAGPADRLPVSRSSTRSSGTAPLVSRHDLQSVDRGRLRAWPLASGTGSGTRRAVRRGARPGRRPADRLPRLWE